MNKLIIAGTLSLLSLGASAQNIQFHYELGRHLYNEENLETGARQDATITYETFKADKLGSWFYFADLNLDKHGVMGVYSELSREFTFAHAGESSSFAAHAEFNGGMNRGGSFQSALLGGVAWNTHSADFSKTFSLQAMYKQILSNGYNDALPSVQLTAVWTVNFAQGKGTFTGFCDVWRDEDMNGHGQMKLLSQPQLWYNVSPKFSIGTEMEVSSNFIYYDHAAAKSDKSFFVNPTIAVKFGL